MKLTSPSIYIAVIAGGLAALAFSAHGQMWVGGWEVIDNGPSPGGGHDVSLWTHGGERIANPDPKQPFLAQALALLSIQCVDGKPTVFINHNFEVAADRVEIAYASDDGPPQSAVWMARSGISNAPDDPVAFMRSLLGKARLKVTLTWPGAAPTSTTFPIAELDRAMARLRQQCGW